MTPPNEILEKLSNRITTDVEEELRDILEKAQKRLKRGFQVTLHLLFRYFSRLTSYGGAILGSTADWHGTLRTSITLLRLAVVNLPNTSLKILRSRLMTSSLWRRYFRQLRKCLTSSVSLYTTSRTVGQQAVIRSSRQSLTLLKARRISSRHSRSFLSLFRPSV